MLVVECLRSRAQVVFSLSSPKGTAGEASVENKLFPGWGEEVFCFKLKSPHPNPLPALAGRGSWHHCNNISMKVSRTALASLLPLTAGTFLLFYIPALWAQYLRQHLGRPAFVTGWWLFAVMLSLGAFNARKKLSMLPLGNASAWLRWHVAGGFLTLALFWLHARTIWPTGIYERVLTALFYLLNLSGIIGWVMQRAYPRALNDTGVEGIYEKIPAVLAQLRGHAETAVLECAQQTGSGILGQYYVETLHWFFQRPRFFWNHALFGGKTARAWVREQCAPVRLYLNEAEQKFLDRLTALAERKAEVDFHYATQALMKRWLLAHLPLAAAVVLLTLWHILLVHIYAL